MRGVLSEWVEINPKTDCSQLTDDEMVSFVPMTAVVEKTNSVAYESRLYREVKKGYTVFQKGDLLWAKITPCMQNGKSVIVNKMETDIGLGSTEFHVIRPKSSSVYLPFLWAILSNEDVLKAAQATFNGSAGQQRVSGTFLERFPAVLPDYDNQVLMVEHLMDKLNSFKQKLAQADELFSSMDGFILNVLGLKKNNAEKKMFFATRLSSVKNSRYDTEYNNPHFTKIVDAIRNLPHATLDEIIEFSSESWNQNDFFEDTFPYIEISGVGLKTNEYETTITDTAEAASRARMIVRNGDIIVSTTRPHRGAIATISCESEEILIASTGFAILRELKRTDVTKDYLQWILLNEYVLEQMLQRSSGGNYPAINIEELKKILIPIPSNPIQQQIADEAVRRRTLARQLKEEANREWKAAKVQFEKELLGEE